MSLSFKLSGSIVAGPASVSENTFPSMNAEANLGTKQTGFQASTGTLKKTITSPGAFLVLSGVGPLGGDSVNLGRFLYIRSDAVLELRLTQKDLLGGADVVKVLPVEGLTIIEFPSNGALTLLEAQGTATIEYLVCGD